MGDKRRRDISEVRERQKADCGVHAFFHETAKSDAIYARGRRRGDRGRATIRVYQAKDGEHRAALSVIADCIASAKPQPRKQASEEGAAQSAQRRSPTASTENGQRTNAALARTMLPTSGNSHGHAAGDRLAHTEFGDMDDDLPWE